MRRLAAVAALLAAACIPEEGPMMEPGSACLECHGGGGGEEDAVAWTVAGTAIGSMGGHQGSQVRIQDAAGKSFSLTANQVGNFYTREPLRFPIQAWVDGRPMNRPVLMNPPDNDCNRCHGSGGGGDGGRGG